MNSPNTGVNEDLRLRFLVIDEDPQVRRLCVATAQDLGFVCTEASTSSKAFAAIETGAPHLIIAGLAPFETSAADLLKKVKDTSSRCEVALAVPPGPAVAPEDGTSSGAYDVLEKPLQTPRLRVLLQHMAEKVRLLAENDFLRARINGMQSPDDLFNTSDGNSLSTTALADLERITILRVFERAGRDKALAGKMLGISRATLYRKLKQYHVADADSELETVRH